MYMNIDYDPNMLKFPWSLPNDLDALLPYYMSKFPPVISYYEETAQKITFDAEAFREYGFWARKELGEAFEKVKQEYEAGDQSSLEFLLQIDARFQKMYCYRFWIVNYLFPDGPVHEFFVNNLKDLIRKIVDVGDSVDDFEDQIDHMQRDLMQGSYGDMYLQQALSGVKLYEQLQERDETRTILNEAQPLIDTHDDNNRGRVNELWEQLYSLISSQENEYLDLKESLAIPLEQMVMRSSKQPFYNMLTHTVEFRDENIQLAERHDGMGSVVEGYREAAREKLSDDEFALFELSYKQAQNFTEFKDIMGTIDTVLLPLWFSLHAKIRDILKNQNPDMPDRPTGPPAVQQHFVWFLPDNLKAWVMTPDTELFDLAKA
jgi:hypothetical protein